MKTEGKKKNFPNPKVYKQTLIVPITLTSSEFWSWDVVKSNIPPIYKTAALQIMISTSPEIQWNFLLKPLLGSLCVKTKQNENWKGQLRGRSNDREIRNNDNKWCTIIPNAILICRAHSSTSSTWLISHFQHWAIPPLPIILSTVSCAPCYNKCIYIPFRLHVWFSLQVSLVISVQLTNL